MNIFGSALLLLTTVYMIWILVSLVKYLGTTQQEHIQREHEARTKHYEDNRL